MDDNEVVGEEHRRRALAKLHMELKKDIARAERIAAACGIWELLRLCYLLRLSRMYAMHPRLQGQFTKAQLYEFHLHDEAVKYAIGLVAKHGSWAGVSDLSHSFKQFNNDLVDELMRHARHINSKFDIEKLLHIANLRVEGERDQDAILDTDLKKIEPKRAIYLHYGLRIEGFASQSKEGFKSIPELVALVRLDVAGLEEQFAETFGLSLDNYCAGLIQLKSMFEAKLQAAFDRIDPQDTGRIDFDQVKSFVALAGAMYFTDRELDASINADFVKYLRSQSFEPGSLQGNELRFHYLTRRPFLIGRGFAVLSSDLCFDSIVDNIRFTLLESSRSKHVYKAAASAKFLDQVAEIAKPYGYVEMARDVDLMQGNRDIGEIDLVLFNASTNHTLLVEGKNHALPLAVYFCGPNDIDDHVKRSRDWEKKVKRRIAHLTSDTSSYEVSGDWDYIVVSRMPEPLAHHTDLLVLCLDEFKQWVAQTPLELQFKEFYRRTYELDKPSMTMAEMEDLMEKGYSLLRTET
jgi:hypothetical protein